MKARLLNIAPAKNIPAFNDPQVISHKVVSKGTIAVVGTSRGVQFPMFALDVSREVEGYVAEASIRSRRLKTEAGDIPGGGGGGYPRGWRRKGKMCGSARRQGERWKAS